MSSWNFQTLVVVGSGPGIGVSTAKLLASRKFNKVALISRDNQRLEHDRQTILDFVPSSIEVEVKTWSIDITNSTALRKTLNDIKSLGNVSCVLFNAARVGPSELLEFAEDEIVQDFLVSLHCHIFDTHLTTNIALYTTAKWAVPILLAQQDAPTFLVTSSLLWADPIPMFFSLSLVKASQRNLVQSLQKTYPDIHFALLNVGGQVSRDDKYLNPNAIAEKYWQLYSESKENWSLDLNVMGA